MPGGGKLVLSSANLEVTDEEQPYARGVPPGAYVLMTVSDNGAGLSPEAQAHLFEPFFTTKEPGKGTGLGLSIVYGIVRQSGGYISISSGENKGTAVRIFLPRLGAAEAIAATQDINPDELRGNERVLLVEDQEQVRELAALILTQFGYEVLEAASADEALLLSDRQEGPIQLLLTDVLMPGLTGCELADRLCLRRPGMMVVYMSGFANREIVDKAMKRPGSLFLQKPFSPASLGAKVREALDDPRRMGNQRTFRIHPS
jgi:CheY-like chemotaxis protein